MSDETGKEEGLVELEDLDELSTEGSKRKKLLILAGVFVVLCNVAWGAVFFLSDSGSAVAAAPPGEAEATQPSEEEPGESAEVADDSDKEGSRKVKSRYKDPGPMYKLDPFVVNLDEPRGYHYLRVSIDLEVKDEASLAEVDQRLLILRDSFISVLSSKRLSDLKRPRDKDALRDELLDLAHEVVDDNAVKSIYFTEFLTQ